MPCLNNTPTKSHEMTFTVLGLSDWEVLHVYQEDNELTIESTILLLRRTVSIGEPFAVGKIITLERLRGRVNEATALAKIPPHPNIIKLYSAHMDVPYIGQVSFVLEFCAGEDLLSLSNHAWYIRRRIPEVFLWHVLCQALAALEHLARCHISHNDIHTGNLLLRPVEGDGYPDVVLADFELSGYQLPHGWNSRNDFHRLGHFLKIDILKEEADEIADDTAPYSQELRNFVNALSNGQTPLPAELKHDLIPIAKKMACVHSKTTHRMPEWMIAHFIKVKSKAVTRHSDPEVRTEASKDLHQVLRDSAAESSAQALAGRAVIRAKTQRKPKVSRLCLKEESFSQSQQRFDQAIAKIAKNRAKGRFTSMGSICSKELRAQARL